MQFAAPHPVLEQLAVLDGRWKIEAMHQAFPGTVIRGEAVFETVRSGVLMTWHSHYDHPDIPDAVTILSGDETGDLRNPGGGCAMHYYDERGVTRLFSLDAEPGVWRYWRNAPGFSQRFTGRFSLDGTTIQGVVELCRDGSTWEQDLAITYRRTS